MPAVARPPELQWVRTVSPGPNSAAPWRAMASQRATSSSKMASASPAQMRPARRAARSGGQPVHGPHQVDRRGPGRAQGRAGAPERRRSRPGLGHAGQGQGRRHADQRRAAHGQALDMADHGLGFGGLDPDLPVRQQGLVEDAQGAAVVAQGQGSHGLQSSLLPPRRRASRRASSSASGRGLAPPSSQAAFRIWQACSSRSRPL